MTLTQEQLGAFWRDGFLSYKRILEDDELALYRREFDREFEVAEAGRDWRNLSANEGATISDQKASPQQMLQIRQMCERNIHFRRLIYDARILDVVQDFIGPNIMLFHDQALYKPAFQGGAVAWHQDNAYWKCQPANLVSCWMTLDDVDSDNGAMQLIPGSHRAPLWHGKQREEGIFLDVSSQVDTSKAVTVPLPAGGCMFHHCQTLHYSAPNTTPRQRRAFAMHFMTPGTRVELGAGPMPVEFSRPMLRLSM